VRFGKCDSGEFQFAEISWAFQPQRG
jgi:hypothetical protein